VIKTVEMPIDGLEWRTAVCCPEYEVSELGHIRRRLPNRRGILDTALRAPYRKSEDWYDQYDLYPLEGERVRTSAHQLVAEAFIGSKPFDDAQIRHLDGNKRNNRPSNLAWGTAAENAADKSLHGTLMLGDDHTNAKLSVDRVKEARRLASTGVYRKDIAKMFNVSRQTIDDAVNRKVWAHVA